mgnify:CR=1 FL=1
MWPIDSRATIRGSVHAALDRDDSYRDAGHAALARSRACRSALLAAHNLCALDAGSISCAKLVLVSSRSVNSLVWALLFVGIFGPGALPERSPSPSARSASSESSSAKRSRKRTRGRSRRSTAAGRACAVAADLRLLAAGRAGVLVDRAVSLGHQRARIRGARPGRRGRHRHDARFRAQSLPVEPRGGHPASRFLVIVILAEVVRHRRSQPRSCRLSQHDGHRGVQSEGRRRQARRPRSTFSPASRSAGSGRSASTSIRRRICPAVFDAHPRLADDSRIRFFVRQRPVGRRCADHGQRRRLCSAHLELTKLDTLLGKGRQRRDSPARGPEAGRNRRPARW